MRIPDTVKIGGKHYSVIRTENLHLGAAYHSAEVDYFEQEIRLRKRNDEGEKVDFLHEIMHCIMDFLGYAEHDEKQIDEIANALYMMITDNPEMFMEETKNE